MRHYIFDFIGGCILVIYRFTQNGFSLVDSNYAIWCLCRLSFLDLIYSLRPILSFANTNVSSIKMHPDTSIFAKGNIGWREYLFCPVLWEVESVCIHGMWWSRKKLCGQVLYWSTGHLSSHFFDLNSRQFGFQTQWSHLF
jgi:hypothetical protein